MKIIVRGGQGQQITVGGVVFEERHIRLTLFNDFHFEVEPSGYLLLIENHDRPGVIGDVGQYLARGNINISSFNLSRNKKGGHAMAIVTVDSQIPGTHLKQLKELPNVENAKALFL